jgi:tripartite-type tricarboxylate transporter receptor subunit TctC
MKKRMFAVFGLIAALSTGLLAGCNSAAAPAPATTKAAAGNAATTAKAAAGTTAAAGASKAGTASAVKWPGSSVQLLVPSKAGGVTDIYTRNLQNYLQTSTKGSFATVNYDTEAVAYENLRSSKADGTSLMFQHSTVICKYLTGAINYNPSKEFRVIGSVADMGSQAIICGPKAPYSTWEEFVKYAKENPGKVSAAIATNGTTHFIFGQVQKKCDIKLNLVECSAEADKLTNVAGGIIDVANCSLGNAQEYEKAGKLKVLGILGSGKAEPNYPQWKPITDVIWSSHLFVFAPAKMDDATAEAISAQLKGVTEDKTFSDACTKIGGKSEYLSVKDARANFDDTMKELSAVAESLGISKNKP